MVAPHRTSTKRFRVGEYLYHTIYEGTREELLARGVLSDASLFADGSERDARGRVKRTRIAEIDGRRVKVTWQRERGLYEIWIDANDEEREARLAQSARELAEKDAAELAKRRAIEMAERGPREVAKGIFEGAGVALAVAFNMAGDANYPWRFPRQTHDQVRELYQGLLELFESGGLREDRAGLAQQDAQFQRMLMRVAEGKP